MSEALTNMAPIPLTLVVAATRTNGIGKANALPWRLSREMKYFKDVTSSSPPGKKNAVIMGRKTWDGIPKKFKPLPGRFNVVLSRDEGGSLDLKGLDDTFAASSLSSACSIVRDLSNSGNLHRTFAIGGAQLYTLALKTPYPPPDPLQWETNFLVNRILLTRILSPEFECDTFFPEFIDKSGGGRDAMGSRWEKASRDDLKQWTGLDPDSLVGEGVEVLDGVDEVGKITHTVKEANKAVKDKEEKVEYEFQMWTR